ncbi:MAG: hypothetical protein ACYS67_09295 [Planctomycetota bacterium]|jgi:alpha-glucuronidase
MSNNENYYYRLSNGCTVIQDIYANLDEAAKGAEKIPRIWKRLNGKVDQHRFQYTLDNLTSFIENARKYEARWWKASKKKPAGGQPNRMRQFKDY